MSDQRLFNPSILSRLGYSLIKLIIGSLVKVVWIRNVEDIDNIPRNGPAIIASNHSSYFDFISIISVSPRKIYYLSAEKFFLSKLWRPIMKLTSQIKVERESKNKEAVHDAVAAVFKSGNILGIFPEGTRSRNGEIGLPFTGAVKYSLDFDVPIIPIGINGAYEIMKPHDKFPRLRKLISIKIGNPINLDKGSDISESTHNLMEQIADLAGTIYKHRVSSLRVKKYE